ncbi:hypothetical protein OGAPHI_005165 [Ogataea philodendri]|uniref:HECT-type E3 ubiquitin transferase E3D n=1 Tax=Ogataea philodendri TaxID=1378263 RepID=A0A9P8P1E9_9ASCO|nr:uncharacterized protein OGAPHI_005165 [Ogataea philodendri]KAH3663763.1 hypothetical protein OGAPHI_005165 [Ogataea philodendri]
MSAGTAVASNKGPLYFTEFLPRLSSVSVCVQVPRKRVVKLSIKDQFLDGLTSTGAISIPLAARTADYVDVLPFVQEGDGFFTLKVPSSGENTQSTTDQLTNADGLIWSVSELRQHPKATLQCSECGQQILALEEVRKLHSMPSELWYEMMEFWHCHKPTSGEYTNDKIASRFNSLRPAADSLIVGAYYFLVPSTAAISNDGSFVQCSGCNHVLGEMDNGNHKLFKWKLVLTDGQLEQRCSSLIYLYSYLLDSVASSAIRFFLVKNGEQQVVLWCFNFGLDVTFSTHRLQNSLKVMYMDNKEEILKFLAQYESQESTQYEVIDLEKDMMTSTVADLEDINTQLPQSQRTFNQWKVSYIGRLL